MLPRAAYSHVFVYPTTAYASISSMLLDVTETGMH
jgi:hypothetical protein